MNHRVLPLIIGLLLLPMGCGDSTGPKLASVVVSPATVTLTAIGGTVQFTAVGRALNGNAIVSGGFVWSSSDPQVATVGESSGLATAVANGSTMISAGTPSPWPVGVRYADCGCTVGGPRDSIGPIQPSHRPISPLLPN